MENFKKWQDQESSIQASPDSLLLTAPKKRGHATWFGGVWGNGDALGSVRWQPERKSCGQEPSWWFLQKEAGEVG